MPYEKIYVAHVRRPDADRARCSHYFSQKITEEENAVGSCNEGKARLKNF